MQVPFFCYYSGFVAEDFRVCLSRGHCEKQIVGIDAKFVRLGLTWNCEWNNSEPNSAISCQGAWRFFSLSYSVFRFYLNNRVLLSRALSCDRLPEEILCLQQVGGLLWSLNIKFSREPITRRAWDRRTLLCLLYNAKFWAKITKNGHHALIGVRWGETLSRHVIDFD